MDIEFSLLATKVVSLTVLIEVMEEVAISLLLSWDIIKIVSGHNLLSGLVIRNDLPHTGPPGPKRWTLSK